MGCCGDREKDLIVSEEQKWAYINLSDFKSTSCLAPFSYAWLWILVLISCAIYLADGFTAVNLLAFDNWSSQVKPAVPFEIAKWIFAITIIMSYVFLLYRYWRAIRVIRSGSVTECYLEPVAVIWQCMRITKAGQGWRRFLVFAELTKSKKGANYIALFVYFQFKSALLVIVAQGPRTAINAMTLYAVMKAQLLPVGHHASKERSNFEQFFMNIKVLVETGNKQETVIYFTMLFSLLIWVMSALGLIVSGFLYIVFLWHYIPRADGTLTQYCRRKVETRLERIVGKKVKKAIEKAEEKRRQDEAKAIKKGKLDPLQTRPTLPKIDQDDNMSVFSLQRTDTMTTNTTLPPYSANTPTRTNTFNTNRNPTLPAIPTLPSVPTLPSIPTLPSVEERPGMPTRSDTHSTNYTNTSYRSNAPLLDQAGAMAIATPTDPMPPLNGRADYFGGQPNRSFTPTGRPFSPASNGRASPMTTRGGVGALPPMNTSFSTVGSNMDPSHSSVGSNHVPSNPRAISPLSNDLRGPPPPPQANRPYPQFSPYDSRGPQAQQSYELSPVDNASHHGQDPYYSTSSIINKHLSPSSAPPQMPDVLRVASPAMSQGPGGPPQALRSGTAPPRSATAPPPRAGTAPPRPGIPASLQSAIQRREASQPLPNRGMMGPPPVQRSATAPIQSPSWTPAPERSYTPTSQPRYAPAPPRGYNQNNQGYDRY
ncbi:Potassium transporter [Pleosporales sp. CAS-2024a]